MLNLLPMAAPARAEVTPVTRHYWQEAVASVSDIDRSARFIERIGGYERKWHGPVHPTDPVAWGLAPVATGVALLIRPPGGGLGTGPPGALR